MANEFKNKNEFKEEFQRRIIERYGRSFEQAHITEKYMILGEMVRDYASIHWNASKNVVSEKQEKQMYYFSMEFLMGRLLTNNLMNLGIYEIAKEGLAELGQDINELEDLESDAGLGNGGLGRLAACFLDSLASLNLAGHGNCIRYEYGLFKQKIVNNEQVEVPDQWLSLGNVWEVRKPKHAVNVNFGGHVDMWMGEDGKAIVNHVPSLIVRAVPYDMPIVGQNTNLTNTLRLWSAEVADDACDASSLNEYVNEVREICRNVYPDDSTEHGKILRLKQQYFFVAAGLNNIIESHMSTYHTLDNFSEKVAIQLNDTHPVLCIPELMRILMDDYKYDWDQAWDITKNTMAYTNHTVLSEALEKWPIQYVQDLLPRVFMIIEEIDRRFKYEVSHDMGRSDLMNECCVLKDGQVHMANLAIIGSHSVNGVAALHTKILKEDVMKNFHDIYPNKFNNKTNGITQRRFLLHANPLLADWITEHIGPDWITDLPQLKKLAVYADDDKALQEFMNIKFKNKERLAKYILEHNGVEVDPHSIFDVQVKRLHEYKRQLLNILHVIYLYNQIKMHPEMEFYPRTFIFGAKASAGYATAKKIIKLINSVADVVNNDASINGKIKVVFIENYRVSNAEWIFAAADVSEQISTASKEASGTGNMKFMLNGAPTLGTMDGANVEIVEEVGAENAFIFGLSSDEVINYENNGGYDPNVIYNTDEEIRQVLMQLINGTFSSDTELFRDLYDSLLNTKNTDRADRYFILADFRSYADAQKRVEVAYKDEKGWAKKALLNTACSGKFTSDRTIQEYVDDIWHLDKVIVRKK